MDTRRFSPTFLAALVTAVCVSATACAPFYAMIGQLTGSGDGEETLLIPPLLLLPIAPAGSNASLLSVSPANSSPLVDNQSIVLQFSASMNTVACAFTDGGLGVPGSAVWSTTSNVNDTLSLSPATTWNTGDDLGLVLANCATASAGAVDGGNVSLNFTVYAASLVRYVKSDGNDANDGLSATTPRATVQAGIADLGAGACSGNCAVFVHDGTYTEVVTMGAGIRMYGGYRDSFQSRVPGDHLTIINSPVVVCGNVALTPCATVIASGITSTAVLDGFQINGTSGRDYTSGLRLSDGYPIVRNNRISAVGANITSAGILNANDAPGVAAHIYDNIINGGSAPATRGVLILSGAEMTLERNTIVGGTSTGNSHGVSITSVGSPTVIVRNNFIDGGTGTNTAGVYLASTFNSVQLYNNTVYAGTAATRSTGILLQPDGSADIRNNIVQGSGSGDDVCVREEAASASPTAFIANDLFNCATLYVNDGATPFFTASTIDGAGLGSGTVDMNPQFTSSSNRTLTSSTPCSLSQGGSDSAGVREDYAQESRTSPVSIGADEWDGSCT